MDRDDGCLKRHPYFIRIQIACRKGIRILFGYRSPANPQKELRTVSMHKNFAVSCAF